MHTVPIPQFTEQSEKRMNRINEQMLQRSYTSFCKWNAEKNRINWPGISSNRLANNAATSVKNCLYRKKKIDVRKAKSLCRFSTHTTFGTIEIIVPSKFPNSMNENTVTGKYSLQEYVCFFPVKSAEATIHAVQDWTWLNSNNTVEGLTKQWLFQQEMYEQTWNCFIDCLGMLWLFRRGISDREKYALI